jgi:hypothetical protein
VRANLPGLLARGVDFVHGSAAGQQERGREAAVARLTAVEPGVRSIPRHVEIVHYSNEQGAAIYQKINATSRLAEESRSAARPPVTWRAATQNHFYMPSARR